MKEIDLSQPLTHEEMVEVLVDQALFAAMPNGGDAQHIPQIRLAAWMVFFPKDDLDLELLIQKVRKKTSTPEHFIVSGLH